MTESTLSPGVRRFIILVDRFTIAISRHWLAFANVLLFIFIGLPMLAPVLMHYGLTGPGELIYTVYRITCHQLAYRSFFLFGEQPVYTLEQLRASLAVQNEGLFFWDNFIGNPALGYKMAWCERDVAIYGSMLLAGMVFGLLRTRVRSLDWRIYIAMIVPMAVDGTTQLFGFRESDWLLRVITGALFGVGSVWLIYPYVQEAMRDIHAQAQDQLGRARARASAPGQQ